MTDISNLTLESRECACGCGSSFRTLATSPQLYASSLHNTKRGYFDVGTRRWVTSEQRQLIESGRAKARKANREVIARVNRRAA